MNIEKTLCWIGGVDGWLEIIDQRQLPGTLVRIECRTVDSLIEAIKTLAVRGAPAIGVAASFGLSLGLQNLGAGETLHGALAVLEKQRAAIAESRPTAVNLFYGLNRVVGAAQEFCDKNNTASVMQLRERVLAEAWAIFNEDVEMCKQIGVNGEKLIPDGGGVLTHCNAGSLATAGQGTALSLLYEAKKKGKRFTVYVDETRPLLQGARLTAWECMQAGLEAVLICDNMAGYLMKQGKIQAVVTGADRIAANGDTANKIGTYSLSVLAQAHGIPFYIAAPSSTFDLNIADGRGIVIEQRAREEIATIGNRDVAPAGVSVYNPAFDVTDAKNITAIITERGVVEKPDTDKIRYHLDINATFPYVSG